MDSLIRQGTQYCIYIKYGCQLDPHNYYVKQTH